MLKGLWSAYVGSRMSAALWPVLSLMLAGCSGDDSQPPIKINEVPTPTFTKEACKHKLAADSTTYCGYIESPLFHSEPDGEKIQLYVTIYPAKDPATATAPLIYLTGGPGSSTASSNYVFENASGDPNTAYFGDLFGDNRDLIVLDQRGTNFSIPSLYCSQELGPLREQAYAFNKSPLAEAMALRLTGMEQCYTRLNGSHNLAAFTTYESASDVRSVALALGHEKVNVYGASAGTRLAMTVMERHPDIVENVAIDSIVPPEVNIYSAQPEGTAFALNALWDKTKDVFPNLKDDFYGTIDKLEMLEASMMSPTVTVTHGDTMIPVTITGVEYVSYVVGRLRNTPIDNTLPYNITQMSMDGGDFTLVAQTQLNNIDFLFPTGEGGDLDAVSLGMFESIESTSDGHYTTVDEVNKNIDENLDTESMRKWARESLINQNANLVGKWPVTPPLPPDSQDPVVSDIHTLMMVGSLDSGTPSIFSEPSRVGLKNNYYFDILAGHAVCYLECAVETLNGFLKDSSAAPTNSCPTDPEWSTTGM